MNKNARAMRDHYGVRYTTALQLIRELGVEAAIEKLDAEARLNCLHSGERAIDRATGDETCQDCGALNPPGEAPPPPR